MKILIADALPEGKIEVLRQKGYECIVEPDLTAEQIPEKISGVEILVVRSTKVISEVFDKSDCLGLVVRSGAGINTIDCQGAADSGIYVCNVPGTNSIAVAELAMGLIISIDRHIPSATADLRESKWNKKIYSDAEGLFGKTLGIVGLGEIGLAVAERARSFGITVIAKKAQRKPETESRIRSNGIKLVETLEELITESDVISIHLPSGPETKNFVNKDFLKLMKPNSILINTSRGEIVDETALLSSINEKNIKAGLDVFCDEPTNGTGHFSSELAQHPNVVGTHHIGASTQQAQNATVEETIRVIDAFREGNVINCVNIAKERVGSSTLTIRHYDKVGVLAEVFAILRKEELNVETMENKIFEGSKAALAIIDVSGDVSENALTQLREIDHIIHVQLSNR
jgi:D-3-phosphoglycerate dehydrogenase